MEGIWHLLCLSTVQQLQHPKPRQRRPAVCVTVKVPCRLFCGKCAPWGGWCRSQKVRHWFHMYPQLITDGERAGNLMSLSFSGLKEDQAASLCQLRPLGPDPRCRRRRRRLIYKVAPLTVSSTRRPALTHPEAPELTAVAGESGQRRECEKEQESAAPSRDQVSCRVSVPPPPSHPAPDNNTSYLNSTPQMEPQVHEVQFGVKPTICYWKCVQAWIIVTCFGGIWWSFPNNCVQIDESSIFLCGKKWRRIKISPPIVILMFYVWHVYTLKFQSEVRLAENYDVFISKAQLDSILVNYTRSGSLLFRKLVWPFITTMTMFQWLQITSWIW